jgi:hypothetical protein
MHVQTFLEECICCGTKAVICLFPFGVFWGIFSSTAFSCKFFGGGVRREFMQRLSAALHGTLGCYLRDTFQEGSVDAMACLPVPRA